MASRGVASPRPLNGSTMFFSTPRSGGKPLQAHELLEDLAALQSERDEQRLVDHLYMRTRMEIAQIQTQCTWVLIAILAAGWPLLSAVTERERRRSAMSWRATNPEANAWLAQYVGVRVTGWLARCECDAWCRSCLLHVGAVSFVLVSVWCVYQYLISKRVEKTCASWYRHDSMESMECFRRAGFTLRELGHAGFSATQMRQAGFKARELTAVGFSAKQLAEAGFDAPTLREAGHTVVQMKRAGFDAPKLMAVGFTPTVLRAVGFGVPDFQQAAFKVGQLKAAGFNATEIREAGFDASHLREAGFTAFELKEAGVNAWRLKLEQFSAAQLYDAGFRIDELKNAGFSAEQLHSTGCFAADLRQAGFTAKAMHKAGYSVSDLLDAGFTPQQLQEIEIDAWSIREAQLLHLVYPCLALLFVGLVLYLLFFVKSSVDPTNNVLAAVDATGDMSAESTHAAAEPTHTLPAPARTILVLP